MDAPVASLMNRDLALPRLQTYLNERTAQADIKLAYPSNDPLAALACKKIKDQVESLFKDVTGKKLTIILESLPMKVLKQRVEAEFVYDLAYVPFDYPDDWYPFALGAMLDPAVSERGGRNWMGFGKQGADEQDND